MENGNRERVKETTTDLIHGHVAETANGHQSEKKITRKSCILLLKYTDKFDQSHLDVF